MLVMVCTNIHSVFCSIYHFIHLISIDSISKLVCVCEYASCWATWVKRSVNTMWIWHIICQINWTLLSSYADDDDGTTCFPNISHSCWNDWYNKIIVAMHTTWYIRFHTVTHTLEKTSTLPSCANEKSISWKLSIIWRTHNL